MEQKEINIAALLKDCPKGTKLYSPICGECLLLDRSDRVTRPHIHLKPCAECSSFILDEYGRGFSYEQGECLLFPSKDNRDWSTFKAPQEEKFKVEDAVTGYEAWHAVVVTEEKSDYQICIDTANDNANIRLATAEEIAKWNKETLEPNHLHYSKSKRKIIHWFLPFDKVVVRAHSSMTTTFFWKASLFSHYDKNSADGNYWCIETCWSECLPYNEKTAHLIGTTEDYHED